MSEVKLISILMPAYNEEATIEDCLRRVFDAPLPAGCEREVIVVDDCSKDDTARRLREFAAREPRLRLFFHERNQGKGAAIRDAVRESRGDICLIQDADLEYDPRDYPKLIEPILSGEADVVFGSRFLPSERRRVLYYWHSLGNRFLTTLSNFFTNLNLTDMETGYKVARGDLFRSIPIRSARFGLEPELTAKFAKRGSRIYEVPVTYHGRSYEEGKKITWKDGFSALFAILRFWLTNDLYQDRHGHLILHDMSSLRRFNRWMADTIRPWVGRRVLETGAGIGNLTTRLLPRERYAATDIDPMYLHYLSNLFAGRSRVEVAKLDLTREEDFQPWAGRFDTVICLNVLEHIADDRGTLRRMRSTLAPGGRLCLLVPQGPALYGTLDSALGHERRYTRRELREKVEEAGFVVEKLFNFNRVSVPFWFLRGRVLRRRTFGRFTLWIYERHVWLWRLLDRVLPWPGISLVCIGRVPEAAAPSA